VRLGDGGSALVARVLDQFDQPFGDSSAIPTWIVAQKTREHVKTVISGDGGDELFGGYTIYRTAAQLGRLRRWPRPARHVLQLASWATAFAGGRETARQLDKALALAGLSAGEALCALRSYFDEADKRALYRPEQAARVAGLRTADRFGGELGRARAGAADLPTALAACDLRHRLAGDMLCKVDMMSMSHGLEVRVPLLDERIVELALRLPPSLRLRGGVTKYLLRRAARRRLPAAIATKPKGGFEIPLNSAAGVDLGPLVADTLESPSPRMGTLFDTRVLGAYARAFAARRPPDGMSRWQLDQRVYALVALERWMRRWEVSP
jgi:asparagine synthase (glutamine-hydrolysing)